MPNNVKVIDDSEVMKHSILSLRSKYQVENNEILNELN